MYLFFFLRHFVLDILLWWLFCFRVISVKVSLTDIQERISSRKLHSLLWRSVAWKKHGTKLPLKNCVKILCVEYHNIRDLHHLQSLFRRHPLQSFMKHLLIPGAETTPHQLLTIHDFKHDNFISKEIRVRYWCVVWGCKLC